MPKRQWYGNEKVELTFNTTRKYRYYLRVHWNDESKIATFILLNPTTITDENTCDSTINRCIHLAKDWGYGGIEVLNLFAYMADTPKNLHDVRDPIGSKNNEMILNTCEKAEIIIAAWGKSHLRKREEEVLELLEGKKIYCIKKKSYPRHPSRVENASSPELFTYT